MIQNVRGTCHKRRLLLTIFNLIKERSLATVTGMVKAIGFIKFGCLYCLSVINFAASWIVSASFFSGGFSN